MFIQWKLRRIFRPSKIRIHQLLGTVVICIVFYNILISLFQAIFRETPRKPSEWDAWQPIGNNYSLKYKVFSAYYDDRPEVWDNHMLYLGNEINSSIRVLSILPLGVKNHSIFCHFQYKNGTITKEKAFKVIQMLQENFGQPLVASFIICVICNIDDTPAEFPLDVGITYDYRNDTKNLTNMVKIRYPQNFTNFRKPKDGIVVCSGPLHNHFNKALLMVEYFEFYKLLGATKFYVYVDTIGTDVSWIIDFYKGEGIVEAISWDIQIEYASEKDIRYDGIFVSLTDCMNRASVIDNIKYVAVADFDEILMPTQNFRTLTEFLKKRDVPDAHSFVFMNVFFFGKYENFDARRSNRRSYLYSQKRTLRSFFPLAYGWRSKYIAKPRKVLELGNHEIWKGTEGTKGYKVNPKDGLSFHYRDSCLDNQCSMPTLPDETAKRYGPQLYHSVDEVCSLIFDKGFCPIENSKMKNYTRKKIRKKRNPHLALSK